MDVDFRDPANMLDVYRNKKFIKKNFDRLISCLLRKPEFISIVFPFFDNWRYKNPVCDIQLDRLRKDLIRTADPLTEQLTNTLYEFRTAKMTNEDRRKVLAAFVEYMVYKKLVDNYRDDEFHRVYAYDLLVYIRNRQLGNKRVDVGLIVCCEAAKAVQIFECKSFPQTDSELEDALEFLGEIGLHMNQVKEKGETHEIFLLTLHDTVAMQCLGRARFSYPNITFLDRRGIINRLMKKPPLCQCKPL